MMAGVLERASQDFSRHMQRLSQYIRQPSVSATHEGLSEMTHILADDIAALGGRSRIVETTEFPIVYGRFDSGALRTVIIHGMYDVVAAEEPDWIVPPFSATRMNLPGLGECIVGRGAEDTKGPLAAVYAMIDAYNSAGVKLPVNIILIWEASELGSGGLPDFVNRFRDELKQADVAYWPWCTQRSDGTAVAWLGAKGLMTFKLRCSGGQWGGPLTTDIHGMHSSWIGNPLFRLVQALASMKTADDLDVAIEGYYQGRREPTAADLRMVKKLASRFDLKSFLRQMDVSCLKQKTPQEAILDHCFKSEFNLSGIKGGVVIENGHKVIIPREAVASLDLRLVDGMSVETVTHALRAHLDKHGFKDIKLEVLNAYAGGGTPIDNWAVGELLAAYGDVGLDPEVWPSTSTAIACGLFTKALGIPWIASCPGHAGGKHGANEYIQVKGFKDAVDFIIRLIWRLST